MFEPNAASIKPQRITAYAISEASAWLAHQFPKDPFSGGRTRLDIEAMPVPMLPNSTRPPLARGTLFLSAAGFQAVVFRDLSVVAAETVAGKLYALPDPLVISSSLHPAGDLDPGRDQTVRTLNLQGRGGGVRWSDSGWDADRLHALLTRDLEAAISKIEAAGPFVDPRRTALGDGGRYLPAGRFLKPSDRPEQIRKAERMLRAIAILHSEKTGQWVRSISVMRRQVSTPWCNPNQQFVIPRYVDLSFRATRGIAKEVRTILFESGRILEDGLIYGPGGDEILSVDMDYDALSNHEKLEAHRDIAALRATLQMECSAHSTPTTS